jgi:periplasmic divalent cation tolerance protein
MTGFLTIATQSQGRATTIIIGNEQRGRKMRDKMKYAVVFVTAANEKEAKKIAESVVKAKLVACVNIVGKINSIYWWQGKIERSPEVLLIMKTKLPLAKKLVKKIKGIHSYKVPEIIFLPIIAGNSDYLKWIGKETVS